MTTKTQFGSRSAVKKHFKNMEAGRGRLEPAMEASQLKPILATLVNEPEQPIKVILIGFVEYNKLLAVPIEGSMTDMFLIDVYAPGKDWCLMHQTETYKKGFLPCNEMEVSEDPEILRRAQMTWNLRWLQEDARDGAATAVNKSCDQITETLSEVIETALPPAHGSYYNSANIAAETITADELDKMIAKLIEVKKLVSWRDDLKRNLDNFTNQLEAGSK